MNCPWLLATVRVPALDHFVADIVGDYFPEPLTPLDRDLLRSLVEVTLDVGRGLGLELAPASEILATSATGGSDVRPTSVGFTLRSALLLPLGLAVAIANLRNNPLSWVENDLMRSLMPRIKQLNLEAALPGQTDAELLQVVRNACLLRDEVFTSTSRHLVPSIALQLVAPLLAKVSTYIAEHADDTSSIDTPTSRLRSDFELLLSALQAGGDESELQEFLRIHGGRGHTFVPLPSDDVWDVNDIPLRQMLLAQCDHIAGQADAKRAPKGGSLLARVITWRLQQIAAAREWVTFGYEEATRGIRGAVTTLGKRFVDQGILADPSHVFLMTLAELRRGVDSGHKVDEEMLLGRRVPSNGSRAPAVPTAPTKTLKGLAAAPGVVEGVAVVVLDDSDLASLKPYQILVCKMTTPAWLPLLRVAGGVVTDMGGLLSHAAIVARSFGIPAVTATGSATTWVRSGKRYRLDGSAGTLSEVGP